MNLTEIAKQKQHTYAQKRRELRVAWFGGKDVGLDGDIVESGPVNIPELGAD